MLHAAEGNLAAQHLVATVGFRRTMVEMTREVQSDDGLVPSRRRSCYPAVTRYRSATASSIPNQVTVPVSTAATMFIPSQSGIATSRVIDPSSAPSASVAAGAAIPARIAMLAGT